MVFEVKTTPAAEQDADEILDWLITQHAGQTGLRWVTRMEEAMHSLAELPERCRLAPENEAFPFEVRELHFGHKPHIYRILFTIESSTVLILHIIHGRRLALRTQ